MIVFVLIIVVIIIAVSVVIYQSEDKEACDQAYNKELLKITEEKEDMKLTEELLNILAEEGYRPSLETGENREIIYFKIEGDTVMIDLFKDDPNYAIIRYHIGNVEPELRSETLERINLVNWKVKYVTLLMNDEYVFATCDILFSEGHDLTGIFLYLGAVTTSKDIFWRLEEEKASLN